MANYNVAGNKIKFTDPMLVNGNLPGRQPGDQEPDPNDPWVPTYDESDPGSYYGSIVEHQGGPKYKPSPNGSGPLDQYREDQMRQLDGQGAAPSGKPDLANPHPESMAGLKAANGGQIPQHLQPKKAAPKEPIFRYDAGSISNRQEAPDAGGASRPELPDAGAASATYGDSEFNSEQAMPWDQTEYNRIASNVGQENQPDFRGPPRSAMMPDFRGPPRSAMMPGVTPVEPNTKNSDLAVNPGFTPYYESETGKDVKEQGRQRLQEYLQKLAGRGKQHEERLAHDNDAAGAKARNDFGALLMDSASMMGTLGGKRADTTQLAKFPGKLYQADMAPSKSAMMYENAEDKDFKSLADIGDRQERTDIARQTMENNREKLRKGLAAKRQNLPYYRPEKDGKPGGILSHDENGNLVAEDVPSGYAPIERPGQDNLTPYPDVYDKDGKPLPTMRNRKGGLSPVVLPPGTKYDPHPVKPRQPPDYSAKLAEVDSRHSNMTENLKNIRDMISSKGTFEAFGPHNAKLDGALYDLAVDYAKLVDPATAAREGEVASAKKYLLPIRESNGMGMKNATAIALVDEFQKKIDNRKKFILESFNQHKAGYSGGADMDRDSTLRGYGLLDDGAQSQGPSAEETRRAKIEKLKRLDAKSGGQQ